MFTSSHLRVFGTPSAWGHWNSVSCCSTNHKLLISVPLIVGNPDNQSKFTLIPLLPGNQYPQPMRDWNRLLNPTCACQRHARGTSPWLACPRWHQQWQWRRQKRQTRRYGCYPAPDRTTSPCHYCMRTERILPRRERQTEHMMLNARMEVNTMLI